MLVIPTGLTLFAGTSHACTVCDSAAGSALRAGIFDGSFSITFLQVVAPFLALAIVLYSFNRHLPD